MTILFVILIVLASVILGLIVLVQNPKGGGLAGSLGGFSNQFMGVKQTTDVLEKGTWAFAGVVGLLCLVSVLFISKTSSAIPDRTKDATNAPVQTNTQQAAPNVQFPTVNPQQQPVTPKP